MAEPLASVVITTKDRKGDLAVAVRSALMQTARPEVLVIDDGSTDGTAEMVRREFPEARVERSERSLGYIAQRNRGARLARGEVIFSIDDDAEFVSARTVEQTLAEFGEGRVGAVAIPYVDVKKSLEVLQRPAAEEGVWGTDAYIGTAHAVRREVFLGLGGYREFLFHQGEERDFCIRMLEAGRVTRLGRADAIHHYESPIRPRPRRHIYGMRNNILFTWWNVPMPEMVPHMAMATVNALKGRQHLKWHVEGVARGYWGAMAQLRERRPVSRGTYRLARRLRKGAMRLEEMELGPMRAL